MKFLKIVAFWLAYVLCWPWLRAVRFRTQPEDPARTLALDLKRPVCFVLAGNSWIDLYALWLVCRQAGLPVPHRTGAYLPHTGRAGVVYQQALLATRTAQGGTELAAVLKLATANPAYDVQLVPVSLFWSRDPGSETSVLRLLFTETLRTGGLRKFLVFLVNLRNLLVEFGAPVGFRALVDEYPTPEAGVRALVRQLHVGFGRTRRAVLGPALANPETVLDAVLDAPGVRLAIEQESRESNRTLDATTRRARRMAVEVAARYNPVTIRILEILFEFVWNRIFNGIDVAGLDTVRGLSHSHSLVYLPSHRSHADYLLLSYVLYHNGLVPPHIAAGDNLNFWPIGAFLRQGGAFYLRRKFAGDKLYTAVFRAYVDTLVRRGTPVEFFLEGGRSRTGRLLSPKAGLLAMVVESALRQDTRPVAIVPVFIGYDRVWEVSSYARELRGATKQKESAEGLLKATKILGSQYGRVYLSFGEPIALQDYADAHLPGWRDGLRPGDTERPEGFPRFVAELARETMTRVNAAATANPVGLTALAMLASPRLAVAREDLTAQLAVLARLQALKPYSPRAHVADADAGRALAEALPVARVRELPHAWGPILTLPAREAVLLTYNRNNLQHLFAVPGLIASLFRTQGTIPEQAVVDTAVVFYPFLRTEFFLPWDAAELGVEIREWLWVMTSLGLLRGEPEAAVFTRPEAASPELATLSMLGRIMGETLERYALTSLLLARQARSGEPLGRVIFEQDIRTMAERLGLLTGRDAPEFFDKSLFRDYLATLTRLGVVAAGPGDTLVVGAGIEALAARAAGLLSDGSRQTVYELLARHARGPVPAGGDGTLAAPPAAG